MKRNRQNFHVARIMGCIVILASVVTGCLQLDEDHCLANGGDLACGGQRCLLQTGPESVTDGEMVTDELGCSLSDGTPPFHFHLTFGLPADLAMSGGHSNLDTVEGILSAWREERDPAGSCALGEEDDDLRDEYVDLVEQYVVGTHIIRANIEDRRRVSATNNTFDDADNAALEAYKDAMTAWLDACSLKVASQASDSGAGS